MEWTKRARKDPGGRKVALVEPTELVSTEEARPAAQGAGADGQRRATRRLKLLAGLLIRGKGEVID